MLSLLLILGTIKITANAYSSYCNIKTSNGSVTAFANGNINKTAFSYGGYRTKANYTKFEPARMTVKQQFYSKAYESGKALKVTSFTKNKPTGAKDKQGVWIYIYTLDTNGTTTVSSASATMGCN